jgi:hypothetical protein
MGILGYNYVEEVEGEMAKYATLASFSLKAGSVRPKRD